jgi:nucleotide-binding universal stress UspA family protein/CheY-like chemotaxis protein
MDSDIYLEKKRILIVDDEPDILETLEDILSVCEVDTALTYEQASTLLDTHTYDAAILDIMGVRGYDLLEICRKKDIPALMLTAHALSPDHLTKSIQAGALAYIPKEKIMDIPEYVKEIMKAHQSGTKTRGAWFAKLRPLFYDKFGPNWRDHRDAFVLGFEKVEHILVPTDFSAYSCEAFPWAAFFAKQFNASVSILHVISEKRAEDLVRVPGNPWEHILETGDRQMVQDFSSCLVGDFGENVQLETRLEVGGVVDQIVAVARKREGTIIVITTHGKTGVISSLLGGVAEKIIQQAPCPVFSVKPKAVEIARG